MKPIMLINIENELRLKFRSLVECIDINDRVYDGGVFYPEEVFNDSTEDIADEFVKESMEIFKKHAG